MASLRKSELNTMIIFRKKTHNRPWKYEKQINIQVLSVLNDLQPVQHKPKNRKATMIDNCCNYNYYAFLILAGEHTCSERVVTKVISLLMRMREINELLLFIIQATINKHCNKHQQTRTTCRSNNTQRMVRFKKATLLQRYCV